MVTDNSPDPCASVEETQSDFDCNNNNNNLPRNTRTHARPTTTTGSSNTLHPSFLPHPRITPTNMNTTSATAPATSTTWNSSITDKIIAASIGGTISAIVGTI